MHFTPVKQMKSTEIGDHRTLFLNTHFNITFEKLNCVKMSLVKSNLEIFGKNFTSHIRRYLSGQLCCALNKIIFKVVTRLNDHENQRFLANTTNRLPFCQPSGFSG